jgi:phosphoribosylanthranilate isomerase
MKPLPFTIKICGITTPADAEMATSAGADAIGLNFYSGSKRFVTCVQAKQIAAAVPDGVKKVGVFVNPSLEDLTAALQTVPLDIVQLHGDETPEFLAQCRTAFSKPIMRALRWGSGGGRIIDEYLARCAELQCVPELLLIDSHSDGQFGGTGATADWKAIAQWRAQSRLQIPLILAGGLTSKNVDAAIAVVRPSAVDTASGVESSPARKDAALVRAFVNMVRRALAECRNPSAT